MMESYKSKGSLPILQGSFLEQVGISINPLITRLIENLLHDIPSTKELNISICPLSYKGHVIDNESKNVF